MNASEYMLMAVDLAECGRGYVSPNPVVGAVIVKDNRVIGYGYHKVYGGLHAEREALASCVEDVCGAVMYVTLEPCCHYGKTSPCTDVIIASGICEVVIGCLDPNPLVAGKGKKMLEEAGIRVQVGVEEAVCRRQNEQFFHTITYQMPWVTMKYAMTLDGKIASYSGDSKWITGPEARQRVHQDRHNHQAIMVGVNTVIVDNPKLTCRLPEGRNPVRIVCDTHLRTPLTACVVTTAHQVPTIIATTITDNLKQTPYREQGCEVIVVAKKDGRVDLYDLMKKLNGRGIASVLLEGGAGLNFAALEAGIVNKVQAYIAIKMLGGEVAKTPVGGRGIDKVRDAIQMIDSQSTWVGEDLLIEGSVSYTCLQGL